MTFMSDLFSVFDVIGSDVIDVSVVEPHSMEQAEVRGRTRDYQ